MAHDGEATGYDVGHHRAVLLLPSTETPISPEEGDRAWTVSSQSAQQTQPRSGVAPCAHHPWVGGDVGLPL